MDLHPVSHPIWPLLWCWGGLTLTSCQSITPLAQIPLTVDVVGCVERHIQAGGIECEINPGQHLTLMVHTEHPRPLQMVVGFEDRKGRRQVIAEGIRFETKTLWQGELPPDLPLAQGQLKVVVWEGALPPGIKGTPWIQWQPQWTPEGWNQAATVTPPLVSRVPVSSPAASCLNTPLTTPDPEVLSACRSAVETWPTAGDPLIYGHVINHLAFQTYFVGAGGDQTATAQALALFEELYKLSKDNGFLKLQLDALRGRGQLALDSQASKVLFREGIDLAARSGDAVDQALMMRKLGEVLYQKEDSYSQALASLTGAFRRYVELGDPEQAARVLPSLLYLDAALNSPELGLERVAHLREWLDGQLSHIQPGVMANQILYREGLLRVRLARLEHEDSRGSLDQLVTRYLEHLLRHPPVGEEQEAAQALVEELILAALTLNELDLAAQIQGKAAPLLTGWSEAYRLHLKAQLSLRRADWSAFATEMAQLERLENQHKNNEQRWRLLLVRGQAEVSLGQWEPARGSLNLAMSLMEESLLDKYSSSDQVVALGHVDREQVFHLAEHVALAQGRSKDALVFAERSRALSEFNEELNSAISRLQQLKPDEWEQGRLEYIDHHQRVQVPDGDSEQEYLNFAENLSTLRAVERSLEKRWWEGNLGERVDRTSEQPAPVPPHESLLEFSLADDELVIYSVREPSVEVVRTSIPSWELAPCVKVLRQRLAPGALGDAGLNKPGCEQKLLAALEQAIPEGTRRLAIVPYGALMDLPLHALTIRGKPLVELVDVVQLTGLATYRPVGTDTIPSRALVIANPTLDLGLTEDEAQVVGASLPGSVILKGHEARLTRVREELPRAELIHYAGHGFNLGMALRETWPILADRQLLTPFDFLLQPLAARVVVLSACESGAGDPAGGGNRRGMVSTLLSAGTETVLATSWPIRSGDALPLMRDFYARWPRQEQQFSTAWAETIRRAVRGELGPRSQSPEVWASFVVWGR